jgi:hypothetical protein
LAALRTGNHYRFTYSRPRQNDLDGQPLLTLQFRERRRPTLVSAADGRDVPLSGTVWFGATDGRVHRTEIRLRDRRFAPPQGGGDPQTRDGELESRIPVRFAADANVGAWVPVEMRERYDNSWGEITTGHATYANYRRFRTMGRIVRPSQ